RSHSINQSSSEIDSEAESISSELESEFEQSLEKLKAREKLAVSPRGPSIELHRRSHEWWTEVRGNLERQTEQLLEDPSSAPSPSTNRRRTKSWLIAKEDMERILNAEAQKALE